MTYTLKRPEREQRQPPIAVVSGNRERLRYITSTGEDHEGDPETIWQQLGFPQPYTREVIDRGIVRMRRDARKYVVVTPCPGSIRHLIRTCNATHWSGVTKGSGKYQNLTHDGSVTVHRLKIRGDIEEISEGLFTFIDYLNEHGAIFRSSIAGGAMSLFKQTLDKPVKMWAPDCAAHAFWPGRAEYLADEEARFYGMAYFDLKAAYPSALAAEPVPIRWKQCDPDKWQFHPDGFSKATAFVPYDSPSPHPLPLRLNAGKKSEALVYPTGAFSGWWPHRDMRHADEMGMIVRVDETWVPAAVTPMFQSEQWQHLRRGLRMLPGIAGSFGKMADNGLWGLMSFDGTKLKRVRWTNPNGDPTSIEIMGAVNGIRETHGLGVALAATSRVRHALWEGIKASNAIYCATDGLIAPASSRLYPEGGEGGWINKQPLGVLVIKDVGVYKWANPGDVDWRYIGTSKAAFDAASGKRGDLFGDVESSQLHSTSIRQLHLRRIQ